MGKAKYYKIMFHGRNYYSGREVVEDWYMPHSRALDYLYYKRSEGYYGSATLWEDMKDGFHYRKAYTVPMIGRITLDKTLDAIMKFA